jgi:Ca-activated chloride channel family protein
MDANIRLDHNLIALETEQDVHVMLELSTPLAAEDASRQPLRLALVLDRSGSMGGPKLENAKRCAAWLAGRLRGADELALVNFDDEVRLLAPLGSPEAAAQVIPHIRSGGSTNLSGGWLKGVEQLRGAGSTFLSGKVLLLTDGLANVGISDSATLVELTRNAAGASVGTSTIGFGDGFDEELLTAMADAGGGNAHYAPTPDAAAAIFAGELDGLTQLAAQNVSVEIRPREQVQVLQFLNDYPAVEVPGGVQLQLGDAYGGDRRRVVFGLHVPSLLEVGVAPIADVVLRYVSVGNEVTAHELTIPVAVNLVSTDEAAAAAPDLEVVEEVLVLKAALGRDEAIRHADEGRYADAQGRLLSASNDLREAGLATEADQLDEIAEIRASAGSYSSAARKRMWYEKHERQRRRRT